MHPMLIIWMRIPVRLPVFSTRIEGQGLTTRFATGEYPMVLYLPDVA